MKSVLITGCSSGFGLETAKFFLEQGWRVIATMRTPNSDLLPPSDNLKVLKLDVTNSESIKNAIEEAGQIDVLVNNAGVGMLNAIEAIPLDKIRWLYETNLFGPIAVIQAALPQMRERKSGVIINVTSSVTSIPIPFLAVYTSTKAALNAFTEVLQLELEPFNIRTRVVLPGRSPETNFAQNAGVGQIQFPQAYEDRIHALFAEFSHSKGPVTYSLDVAKAIYSAATEANTLFKIPAGEDAIQAEAFRIANNR